MLCAFCYFLCNSCLIYFYVALYLACLVLLCLTFFFFFFFKQKTAYEMRISDWSSDVCSSDLVSTMTYGAKHIGEPILKVDNITLAFGGVKALSDISFAIREHEILAIIGPNGAGKTSMLNVIKIGRAHV